ncbi:putative arginyl-tRNA synthetase [Tripterygium wilfordii]|uniref:Putative arginyl-tRNA synthetase n=1 Tax=Tripterygium wilfordii TaxID=458696 RepID=A0A7J7DQ93_TRIWF|nr:putative arginyl-tRNA synthetase [Tripterygium wilfordii]
MSMKQPLEIYRNSIRHQRRDLMLILLSRKRHNRLWFGFRIYVMHAVLFSTLLQLYRQGGEHKYRQAWAKICEISRMESDKVYQRLGVQLEEKGESFYDPYIPGVIEALSNQGLVEES